MPIPPATAAVTNATRTMSGSTPMWRPSPAHTPPTTRWRVSRRRAGAGRVVAIAGSMIPGRPGMSVALGETARQEDRAEDGADQRAERREAQLEHAGVVEQQDGAEQGDRQARDQRRAVRAPAASHGP